MYKYFSLILITVCTVFLSACETDFNPNAEYKDITVVYGLLNQSDTFTYIKINKAFLGDASAYVMAQNEELSRYESLEVKMEEVVNEAVINVFNFDTTTVYNKEPGIFYAPRQVLYKCNTLNQLKQGVIYKLTIKNKITGKIISAQTTLVNKFYISRPSLEQKLIDFILPTLQFAGKTKLEWSSATGGKRYQVNMRINYFESLNDTLNYQPKYIDVNLGTQTRNTLEGGTEMSLEFTGITFYESLKNNLIESTNEKPVYRIIGKIEFLISVAGDDLSTYIEVNEASNSIVQVRPEFTNVNNGIGIFSARHNNAVDNPRIVDLGSKSRIILHSQYSKLGF